MTLATVGRKPFKGFELSSNMIHLTVVSEIDFMEVGRLQGLKLGDDFEGYC